jgi:hypothetical protein
MNDEIKNAIRTLGLKKAGATVSETSYYWSKKGGYAGQTTCVRAIERAMADGWTRESSSVFTKGTVQLTISLFFAADKADNMFTITLGAAQ